MIEKAFVLSLMVFLATAALTLPALADTLPRDMGDNPDYEGAKPVSSNPDYQITADGTLNYQGDTPIECRYVKPGLYTASVIYEEQAEICEEAGFTPGEALPETGGPSLVLVSLIVLLVAGMPLRAHYRAR